MVFAFNVTRKPQQWVKWKHVWCPRWHWTNVIGVALSTRQLLAAGGFRVVCFALAWVTLRPPLDFRSELVSLTCQAMLSSRACGRYTEFACLFVCPPWLGGWFTCLPPGNWMPLHSNALLWVSVSDSVPCPDCLSAIQRESIQHLALAGKQSHPLTCITVRCVFRKVFQGCKGRCTLSGEGGATLGWLLLTYWWQIWFSDKSLLCGASEACHLTAKDTFAQPRIWQMLQRRSACGNYT